MTQDPEVQELVERLERTSELLLDVAETLRSLQAERDQLAGEVENIKDEAANMTIRAWNQAANEQERAEKAEQRVAELEGLLRQIVDPDECRYDHHDECQTHGLDKRPCPNELARQALSPEGQG